MFLFLFFFGGGGVPFKNSPWNRYKVQGRSQKYKYFNSKYKLQWYSSLNPLALLFLIIALLRASQGGCMFPCSLEKIGDSPLFPKNKLRCSLKFTLVKFPCSRKFYCMFPWSPEIFFNVPQNSQHISVFDARLFS